MFHHMFQRRSAPFGLGWCWVVQKIMFLSLSLSLQWTVGLIWKRNRASVVRDLLGGLCALPGGGTNRTEWDQLQSIGMFFLFPSLWLQPNRQESDKESLDSAVRVRDVPFWCLWNLPVSACVTEQQKRKLGSLAQVGLWWHLATPPSVVPVWSSEWQAGLCATPVSPYYAFFPG